MKMKNSSDDFNEYYIPKEIKAILSRQKKNVYEKDWDKVYLIDGGEGTGKSLLALQLGYFLDPTLNIDRITFRAKEFGNALNHAQKGQCVIFDEAFNGLASTSATSKINKYIVNKLMEVRQKNLFIIIVLPTFFLLQKYAALFRSEALFHVYSLKNGDRGYYKIYNRLNKKILYLRGKTLYSYSQPYIKKSWRFYGKYPIDEEAYRKKKASSFKVEEEEEKYDNYAPRTAALVHLLKSKHKMTYSDQLRYLDTQNCPLDNGQLSRLLKKYKEIDPNAPKKEQNDQDFDF